MMHINTYSDSDFWGYVDAIDELAVFSGDLSSLVPPTRARPVSVALWRERKREMIITALRDCAARGMTHVEAAAHVGVSYCTCRNYAKTCGIKFQRNNNNFGSVLASQRAARMAEMYAGGMILEEIGREYGVTRERVRQLIKKYCGMTRADGGMHARAARRAGERTAADDARCLKKWGCTRAQWRRIPVRVRHAYQQKRRNVISSYGADAWAMTLLDYYCAWEASGKLGALGRGRGSYGVSRIDSARPFAPDNVEVVLNSEAFRRAISRAGVLRDNS